MPIPQSFTPGRSFEALPAAACRAGVGGGVGPRLHRWELRL